MRILSLFTAVVIAVLAAAPAKAATVQFDHVCTSPAACDFDDAFAFSIFLDASVVSANGSYDTSSDGGTAFGWSAASSVGDGFFIFGNLFNIAPSSLELTFEFDSFGILSGIFGNGPIETFSFFDLGFGTVVFDEISQSFVERIWFLDSDIVSDSTPIVANWAVVPIPLPAPLLLLVTALVGLFGVSRFKRQAVVAA